MNPLMRSPRRIQVAIAGQAHPLDDGAKRSVQRIFVTKDLDPTGAQERFGPRASRAEIARPGLRSRAFRDGS